MFGPTREATKWLMAAIVFLACCCALFTLWKSPKTHNQSPKGRWFGKDEVLVFLERGRGAAYERSTYPDGAPKPFQWRTAHGRLWMSPGGEYQYGVHATFGGLKLTLQDKAGNEQSYAYD